METKMMHSYKHVHIFLSFFFLVGIFTFISCEEEFEPDYANIESSVVVEAYTTVGDTGNTTFAFISKTYSLFQPDGQNQLPEYYTGDAQVWVLDGDREISLQKICTESLDSMQKALLLQVLGIDISNSGIDICAFVDLFDEVNPQPGNEYELIVRIDEMELDAVTTVPERVAIDSITFEEQQQIPNFGLLNVHFSDPEGPNFYRLKISVNGSQFSSGFGSVSDDIFFDGQSFNFPIGRPFFEGEEVDPATAGLFEVGDTVVVEWSTIDEAHFDFWNTLEFAQSNQGPFSSYSRAKSNINGGIGIWGGYNTLYYQYIVQ